MNMQASQKAYDLIKAFEKLELKAYKCAADVLTIGYGHTGSDVVPGMTINETYANAFLKADVKYVESQLNRGVKVPLEQCEFDSMVCTLFNTSHRSDMMLMNHVNNSKQIYKDKVLLYSSSIKGEVLKGLKIRRICERLLFENKEWTPIKEELQKKEITIQMIMNKQKELFG